MIHDSQGASNNEISGDDLSCTGNGEVLRTPLANFSENVMTENVIVLDNAQIKYHVKALRRLV